MTSTSYPKDAQDWQGRFIANMAAALARRADVNLALWAPPGQLPPGTSDAATAGDVRWLQQLSKQGGMAHQLRRRKVLALGSAGNLLLRLGKTYRRQAPSVAHVNWLQNALPLWGTRTPALITVLGTDFALLKLPGMQTLMRAMLRQRRAILAPNAEWMRPTLEQAFGDLAEIRPIAFGVDDPWFKVKRHAYDPAQLAATPLPSTKLEGCHCGSWPGMTASLMKPGPWIAVTRLTHKKIGDLFTWGEGLFGPQRPLHLFGPMQEQMTLPPWVHYHGPTHPAELLNEWFPKAAGLITLSRHDEGRPQVMLEAMAAGLPVLASDLPAHRDMVQHRQTGWLAKSPTDLAQALTWLEDPLNNLAAGQAARQWVKDTVGTWDDCAGRYAAAYQTLLEPSA